jgi:YidC/Oxa1 family membrane protein insertase
MERRVLIAVLLSFLVLYGYQALFSPPPEPNPAQTTSKAATAPKASGPAPSNPAPSVQGAQPAEAVAATVPAREIEIDNADVHAVFTTRGAVLKSWKLKKYRDNQGQPFEIIAGHAPADSPLPFTLVVDDPALAAKLAAAPFTVASEGTGPDGSWQAQFVYADDAARLRAQKIFSIAPGKPYLINVTASVTVNGQPVATTLRWGPALASGINPGSATMYSPPPQPIFFKDGEVTRISPDEIPSQSVQEGTFGFVGVDDHYFLVAAVKPSQPLRVEYGTLDVALESNPAGAHYVTWSARFSTPPQATAFFAGPKDFDVLASVDRDLVRAIDFGMFAWLVVPLLRALKWLNLYVGNYGWSLILLTVLINLAMFPLRHKSVVSMRKMQDVQPEVKAIQDRYAKLKMSDPARGKMNTELMALYKERGVNPASGCVPMLLTLPVLFAFYSMLSVAIELRGAPFIWQIRDLSAHDPWFIWPILMGVTMFIQQKMTPSTADPMQQKIMLFMPIMMTGMFLWAASGLVIYWTISNVWGIGQQMITNRIIGPQVARTVRPPAERQVKNVKNVKNVGGGKTAQAKDKERES